MTSAQRKILWAAVEDYAGLWELVWELATSCPEIPEAERRAVAERVVRDLLNRDYIRLYERNQIGEREELVPRARWDEVLSTEANWHEPSIGSTEVLIGATPAGEQFYRTQGND